MPKTNTVVLLSQFIEFEQECRESKTIDDLGYIAVNRLQNLFGFTQAYFWKKNMVTGKITIRHASFVDKVNDDTALVAWIKELIKTYRLQDQDNTLFDKRNTKITWDESVAEFGLSIPLISPNKHFHYGLLFFGQREWSEETMSLSKLIQSHLTLCLQKLKPYKQTGMASIRKRFTKKQFFLGFIVLILIFLIPVRLTMVAEADIMPMEPYIVSAQVNSTIQSIRVNPNQPVKKNELLVELDATEFITNAELAEQQQVTIAEKLRKTHQASFEDEKNKMQLALLRLELSKAKTEYQFANALLGRTKIYAPGSGIAIFNNKTDWLGKPVKIGEKIMLIAEPKAKKLVIELPISDLVPHDKNAPVSFYSNIDPLKVYKGKVLYTGHETQETENGQLVYIIEAKLNEKDLPAFGTRGTAKIIGNKTTLFYYVFRRPIYFIRHLLGI